VNQLTAHAGETAWHLSGRRDPSANTANIKGEAMSDTNKTGALDTKFVTAEETEKLLRIIDLALDDLDHVAGGQPKELVLRSPPPSSECACVNCCSAHPL
jgi:hypothetical protein